MGGYPIETLDGGYLNINTLKDCFMTSKYVQHLKGFYLNNGSGRRDIHGEPWKKWMRHCKLDPERCDKSDTMEYMDEDERNRVKNLQEEKIKQTSEKVKVHPRKYRLAQYYDQAKKVWYKGWIVCPENEKAKRWLFVKTAGGTSYTLVPSDWFYEIPENEIADLDSPAWKNHIRVIDHDYNEGKQNKSNTKRPPASSAIDAHARALKVRLERYRTIVPMSRWTSLGLVATILLYTRASEGHGTYNLSEFAGVTGKQHIIESLHWMKEVDGGRCVGFSTTAGLNSLSLTPPRGKSHYTLDDFLESVEKYY